MTTLRDWLEEGPFSLALSSAFFGFYAHCGLAEALYELGCVPARITGASAGALVGGALASGLSPKEARDLLFGIRREHFWDPAFGPGYLRGEKFRKILERNFAPSFSELKIPLEVCVFDLLSWRTRFLAEGALASAVVASCAVPLMFHPVRIDGRLFIDGGVFHKSGIRLLYPEERTLCVFLQGEGPAGVYEWRTSLRGLGTGQRVLRFRGLPQVRPHRLDAGPEAYRVAYERTKRALQLHVKETVIEG